MATDLEPYIKRHGPPGAVRAGSGQRRPYGSVAPLVRAYLAEHGIGEAWEISRDLGLGANTTSNGVASALKAGVDCGELVQPFREVYALPAVGAAMLEAARVAAGAAKAGG